jgi:hypothetical protein
MRLGYKTLHLRYVNGLSDWNNYFHGFQGFHIEDFSVPVGDLVVNGGDVLIVRRNLGRYIVDLSEEFLPRSRGDQVRPVPHRDCPPSGADTQKRSGNSGHLRRRERGM